MIFRKVVGIINSVEIKLYEKLISKYVEKVKHVDGVKAIMQMGSFTAPGLSDIDIIVVVDNDNFPKWEDISIKLLLKEEKGYEVIAHDVFVYPEYLSNYIEGLFYIDRKIMLYGEEIGGKLPAKMIEELKLILSFEYTINRLEILAMMVSSTQINIREILLYISTLRHTYTLLNSFKIIDDEECERRIAEIENLRLLSIDNGDIAFKEGLSQWILPSYEAVYESVLLLGEKLNYRSVKPKKWVLNYKKLVVDTDTVPAAVTFFTKNDKLNKKFRGKVLVEAMPSLVHNHVDQYKKMKEKNKNDFEELDAIHLRYQLAICHKKFIKQSGYPLAKSYIIIENERPRLQDIIKEAFLTILSIT